VAALDRALALEEVHGVAVVVGQDLDLDVARPQERLLQVEASVAEGGRASRRARSRAEASSRASHQPQPLPPPPAAALSMTGSRCARPRGGARRVVERLAACRAPRARPPPRPAAGRGLLAHERDRLAARADEDEPGLLAGAREVRVLGQEAVAGMDGVAPRRARASRTRSMRR
jgi:hypothetical protein